MRPLKLLFLILISGAVISRLNAQQLDENSKIKLILSDGKELYLLSKVNAQGTDNDYYYLPTNLRVSVSNNKPEISLIVYNEGENAGGILHLLLTWGLNNNQVEEAAKLLKKKLNANASIVGQVMVNEGEPSFSITSEKPIARILEKSLHQNSHIPLISGAKFAASFKLNAEDVKEITDAKKDYHKLKDINIQMNFTYQTMGQRGAIRTAAMQNWCIELPATEIFKYF